MKKTILFPLWLVAYALQMAMVISFIGIALVCQPVQGFLKWYAEEEHEND